MQDLEIGLKVLKLEILHLTGPDQRVVKFYLLRNP